MGMNLKEALDTAPYICILSTAPTACAYGPYAPDVAFEFCARYNTWLTEHNFEGTWVAVPLIPASDSNFPTVKDNTNV